MSRRPRIAFILMQDWPGYGKTDYDLLKKHFSVKKYLCKFRPRYYWDAVNIFWYTLWADIVFTQGVSKQAHYVVKWARLLGKKSIVGTMGEDVDDFKKSFSNERIAFLQRVLSSADCILTHSNHMKRCAAKFTTRDNIQMIYYGFSDFFKSYEKTYEKKERMVITQSTISKDYIERKRLDIFVEASTYLPDVNFVIIGLIQDKNALRKLEKIAKNNIRFTGYIPTAQLRSYMHRAKVYAQLSVTEGFGWSLAEAMLCECVPVVTGRGAIPEVVGDAGYYVPVGDANATAEAIKAALDDETKGGLARKRIITMFPLKKREEELVKLIKKLAE